MIAPFESKTIEYLISRDLDTINELKSYFYILEIDWLLTMRVWKNSNFMKRPWWKFWISKEDFFKEEFKKHLLETEKRLNEKK